jgi:hypothetical protein
MSLRAAALLDLAHGEAPCAWLERLELLQFHAGLSEALRAGAGEAEEETAD